MSNETEALIRAYYDRFNAGDVEGFLALLDDQVVHDINEGAREIGKAAFRRFLEYMNRCYRERVRDLVVMTDRTGTRAAAEFFVDGMYQATDNGLPAARGQSYSLRVGAFFEVRDGKIARVSNHYSVKEWLKQVA
ncbi:MAG TPA: ketosteroid isomerase-related protein [Alphaproteobacteria bacterium]